MSKSVNNKKVKNATPTTYNNIKFKSRLEVSCYKKLEASGFKFKYESDTLPIWEGKVVDNVTVYEPNKKDRKILHSRTKKFKLRDITYTPDFRIDYKNFTIYVDAKGFVNDVYPMKKKMFIQYLNELSKGKRKYLFFEPHNMSQIEHMIKTIKLL